jgi:hypothetical protein
MPIHDCEVGRKSTRLSDRQGRKFNKEFSALSQYGVADRRSLCVLSDMSTMLIVGMAFLSMLTGSQKEK